MKAKFEGIRYTDLAADKKGTLIPTVKAMREHLGIGLAEAMSIVRSGVYATPPQLAGACDIEDVEDRLIRDLAKIGVTLLDDAGRAVSVKAIDREASGLVFKADLDKAKAEVLALKEELMLTIGKLALANGMLEAYRQDIAAGAALPPAHDSDAGEEPHLSASEDEVVRIQRVTADGNQKTLLTLEEVQLGFEMARDRVLALL